MRRLAVLALSGALLLAEGIVMTHGPLNQQTPSETGASASSLASGESSAPQEETIVVAQAQAPNAVPDAGSGVAPEAPASPPAVDETALRYFARSGDTRRLEAEIARLQALYPDWAPPDDPAEVPERGDPELDRIWELYAQGQYGEAREAIAERQAREPDWQVPADLIDRLGVAEARRRLVNASNLQQYETVVRVAAEAPSLLTCSEVDVLWRVARAFAETERPARALDAYRYVLENCDNSGERLATIQMAAQQLDRPAVDELLGLERETPEGVGEFASIRLDLARASVAAVGEDESAVVSPDDLERLEASAEETGSASDLLLLGWYHLIRDEPQEAEDRFRRSNEAEASDDAARGLALALIELERPEEAEAVARPIAESSDDARAVYAAAAANLLAEQPTPILTGEQLSTVVAVTATLRQPALAQQLGWYAYSLNQFATADQWFAAALGWKPDEEPAAFGLALVRQRLGDAAGLARLQAAWSATSPRIAAIGREGAAGAAAAVATLSPIVSSQPPQSPATAFAPSTLPPAVAEVQAAAPLTPVVQLASAPQPAPAQQPSAPAVSPRPAPAAAPRTSGAFQTAGCRSTIDPRTLAPDAALPRGWCLMEIDRPAEAANAFEVALLSGSQDTRRDAAYGQSLAYLRLGLTDKAAISATKAPQSRDRQLELEIALLTDQATSAFEAKRPVEALMALDERARIAPERLDLMVLRGYAYLELRRYQDATRVFSAAARAGSREGARGVNAVREAQGYFAAGG